MLIQTGGFTHRLGHPYSGFTHKIEHAIQILALGARG